MSDHSTDYSAAKHEATFQQIDRVPTIDQPLPAKDHEKLYLSPENAVKGQLRKTFGNPTPVALAGFLLANTPASCDLMGWRGAGGHTGNAASGIASYYFFGGMLLLAGGIGEWVLVSFTSFRFGNGTNIQLISVTGQHLSLSRLLHL